MKTIAPFVLLVDANEPPKSESSGSNVQPIVYYTYNLAQVRPGRRDVDFLLECLGSAVNAALRPRPPKHSNRGCCGQPAPLNGFQQTIETPACHVPRQTPGAGGGGTQLWLALVIRSQWLRIHSRQSTVVTSNRDLHIWALSTFLPRTKQ